jgi:hypothetical protein
MGTREAMDRAARAGKGPEAVKRAGMRAEDRLFWLILAVMLLCMVATGLAAVGRL